MTKAVKTKTTHPRTGSNMNIDSYIYEPIKAAIFQSLKGSKGKLFTELANDVTKIIKKKMPDFKKNISWYTISIRLDLETQGLVETFTEKGRKYNRLKK